MSTTECVSNNLRVREKGIVILALCIFIHNAVYYIVELSIFILRHVGVCMHVCVRKRQRDLTHF